MFGKQIPLFKLLGFEVRIDISWVIIAVLVTWSLAAGFFPQYYPEFTTLTYWWMGAVGAIGLFISVIFHELCHSLVARRYGLTMKGITLFIFGGVAEMPEEPENAKTEFLMAIAGPASSIFLSFFFYGIYVLGFKGWFPKSFVAITGYLSLINLILAIFNLLPAFPLDGGRVFRAALWKWKNNLRWATHVASQFGSFFGLFLIFLGLLSIINGNLVGGIWWFLIGMFLRNASQMSYKQMMVRKALEGETVSDFMKKDPVTVSPSLSVQELVDDYIYKYHYKFFPVTDNGKLVGCVTTRQVKGIPREEWNSRLVRDVAVRCSSDNTITSDTDAVKAMSVMNRMGNSRLMVVKDDRLEGIITMKDMLRFLSVKMDLDESE